MEALVTSLVFKFGPLTTNEIEQLVECHNQNGKYGNAETIYSNVGEIVNRLFNIHRLIAFSSITGMWYKFNDKNFHKPKLTADIVNNKGSIYLESISPKKMYFRQLGIGTEYVYAIYPSDLRIDSIINGRKHFPLKVGKTNNIARRVAQLSEAGPNTLTIGILFKTDDATSLERFIHGRLKQQGQFLSIPGRKEWFLSNLYQVTSLYHDFVDTLG